ncbi:hypothetical protein DSO57_1030774 [Entomophthora muscae]|uniref:Uncharacterized protein n=1 Tax=Entomophthora muscae TaxID=34485 RepID=A0ACC2UMU3_9FUNG|nr:hypothetical protein DSO57_1030774 [Entomophthora muscae]
MQGSKGVCHQCGTCLCLKDVVTCIKCTRHICHTCLIYCYAISPYNSPRLSEACLVCLKKCNCKACYLKSNFKPHHVATTRFIQADYYDNYLLTNYLVYKPICENSTLEANMTDYSTFIDQTQLLQATQSLVPSTNL